MYSIVAIVGRQFFMNVGCCFSGVVFKNLYRAPLLSLSLVVFDLGSMTFPCAGGRNFLGQGQFCKIANSLSDFAQILHTYV